VAGPVDTRRRASAQVYVDDPGSPVVRPEDLHHLVRVLRLRTGESVIAADGRGTWVPCRFARPDAPGEDVLVVDGPPVTESAPTPGLTIAVTPVKGERTEWVVQKLTEIGVDRIELLAADRSVVRWDDGRGERVLARLGAVARTAGAQSRRIWLPELTGTRGLGPPGPALTLAEPGGPPPTAATHAVAVGPEGGWSDDELAAGYPTVGLGPHVLRAETAAVAAAVILVGLRSGTVAEAGGAPRVVGTERG
jgi:16S rRNA (uracil1498-N3)-methyltransferase